MLTYSLEYIWGQIAFNPTWQESIKWTGNLLIMSGAAALALSLDLRMSVVPYIGFMIGHILWGLMGFVMKDRPLMVLNWGFIPLDINAISIST